MCRIFAVFEIRAFVAVCQTFTVFGASRESVGLISAVFAVFHDEVSPILPDSPISKFFAKQWS